MIWVLPEGGGGGGAGSGLSVPNLVTTLQFNTGPKAISTSGVTNMPWDANNAYSLDGTADAAAAALFSWSVGSPTLFNITETGQYFWSVDMYFYGGASTTATSPAWLTFISTLNGVTNWNPIVGAGLVSNGLTGIASSTNGSQPVSLSASGLVQVHATGDPTTFDLQAFGHTVELEQMYISFAKVN